MTATTLTGRRLLADIRQRHGEIDAALALGLEPRQAIGEIAGRQAAAEALIPALDQTRNVGLVTLPGAFVGMILGGAPPAQAAMVQLVVLIALLTTEAAAALLTAELVAWACSCGTASVVVPQVINETR
jgi:putative ABC transport system permease protein